MATVDEAGIPRLQSWEVQPDEFADSLSAASVDSVTIFAKCHQGYSYYPTKVGVVHPSLASNRNLLGETIDALSTSQ
jgi:hypothetical protein